MQLKRATVPAYAADNLQLVYAFLFLFADDTSGFGSSEYI